MRLTDDEDFVAFVEARRRALEASAYLMCGDRHLAQDLVQEALVKVAARWERLSEGSPEAYARRVMYRDAVSRWRKLRREVLSGIGYQEESLGAGERGRPGGLGERAPRCATCSSASRNGSARSLFCDTSTT